MATPTPWQVANVKRRIQYRRIEAYKYDPYNFSHVTTTNGTNVAVTVPATGPNAAGATPPTSTRQIESVTVIATGTERDVIYGNNLGSPRA